MMRNKLNLSTAADLIEEEYVKRDLPGEGLAVLFDYLSHGDLRSYIDLPAIYNIYPEINKFEWAKLAYIQFKVFFDFEDGDLSTFSIERDLFVHYIIPAMLSSDYAKSGIAQEEIFLDYVSLVPEKVEIFVYDDDLALELAKLPSSPEGRGNVVRKKAGAPEKDRGWLYFTAAIYMTLYHSKFGKNASDKEIMNFISGPGGLMESLPDQISEVTLQRELAEMKRRRLVVTDQFQKKFGESI